jgi:23S rRNA G2445 N2-methylase RlmL
MLMLSTVAFKVLTGMTGSLLTKTLAVDVTGKNQHLNHSHFTALQVKNAIVDQQRERWGEPFQRQSSISPDVRVNVHIDGDRCTVSLDSSGHQSAPPRVSGGHGGSSS